MQRRDSKAPDDVRTVLQESLSQVQSAAPRRPPELAQAIAAAVAKIKTNSLPPAECLQVLKRACELEGSPNLICAALMSFERLMPLCYFAGPAAEEAENTEAGTAPRSLMDLVIDVVCNCSEQARDDVQLRLVGAISIAVTSPTCEVHGKSLIRAVSTCFKVYKNSTNASNQQVSKDALMRIALLLIQIASSSQLGNGPATVPLASTPTQRMRPEKVVQKLEGGGEMASWVMVPNPTDGIKNEWVGSYLDNLIEQVVVTSASALSKRADLRPSEVEEGAPKILSLQLRDALQVLLSFSKQTMKDPIAGQLEKQFLRSKRISLEMIFCMLDAADDVFMLGEHCVRILTQTLCLALIKNSVSSLPDVFEVSFNIFLTLVAKCRAHMKREIGVFVTQVLLQILTSGNSTYQHKQAALNTIVRMCMDAPTAIEFFLNFDCHLESDNVFEIIVERLSQIAQGKYMASEHSSLIDPQQEGELKVQALTALVKLSGALADWAHTMPAGAADDPDALPFVMERRKRKLALKRAVEKFNLKPKKGMVDLLEGGFIIDTPESLAELFCKQNTGLDKTVVGDYLGENKPFNMSVLQALIDSQNFKELGVDGALRQVLTSFRLPGEAQKIDRIIDGFSKKYCQDNPGAFRNSDTAHILAFSVMMLQTDLHSSQIKNKMTPAAFVSNNRGIDDGKDLQKEYLEGLYAAVQANPFSLKEDDDARTRLASQQAQTVAQKMQLFCQERDEIVSAATTKLMMPVTQRRDTPYVAARIAEHACPTFSSACWPLLAAFTTVLQEVDEQTEPGIMELCVEGLKLCVRVTARFDMHTKRDAVVSALAMFTYLMTLKEIKQKNVECIKALFNIALTDGGHLANSWQHVLQCLSRLEQLQLISNKAQPDFQYFQAGGASASTKQVAPARNLSAAGITTLLATGNDEQVEQLNSLSVMSQVDSALIDRLFVSSANLDASAIVSFVVQLVRVSRDELEIDSKPRVFSLHKLVEVGDYNMNRPSTVWAQIWEPLSQHLVEVAQRPNKNVNMYAIDSLRQLATRFLDKDEPCPDEIRMVILKPFEVMITSTRMSDESKSYVVDAVLNIVQSRTKGKTGWKAVLRILEAVSWAIKNDEIIQRAFTAVTAGLKPLFEEHFQESMQTICAFAKCQASVATSLEAIKCLQLAANFISSAQRSAASAVAEVGSQFFSILKYLADSVWDQRKDVRGAALETLFEILCEHTSFLDGSGWECVLTDVIEPLFKGLHDQLKMEGAEQTAPVYLAALKAFSRLFEVSLLSVFFQQPSVLTRALVPLERAVRQETEAVTNAAVANAARECLRVAATCASKQTGMDKASTSILETAAKALLQNGSSGDKDHP